MTYINYIKDCLREKLHKLHNVFPILYKFYLVMIWSSYDLLSYDWWIILRISEKRDCWCILFHDLEISYPNYNPMTYLLQLVSLSIYRMRRWTPLFKVTVLQTRCATKGTKPAKSVFLSFSSFFSTWVTMEKMIFPDRFHSLKTVSVDIF